MIEIYFEPKKAILKATYATADVDDDAEGAYVEGTEKVFVEGSEVFVLGLAYEVPYGKVYVIYSTDQFEATTFHEKFLDFGAA